MAHLPFPAVGGALRLAGHGVEHFPLKRGESLGMRFRYFENWLSAKITGSGRPDYIIYEIPIAFHKSMFAAQLSFGFQSLALVLFERYGLQVMTATAGEVKKIATGKGNAVKEQMVAAARQRFPREKIEDDNDADALFLALLAARRLNEAVFIEEPKPKRRRR